MSAAGEKLLEAAQQFQERNGLPLMTEDGWF